MAPNLNAPPPPPNNDIDPGSPGPVNLMFANQFKCITQVKLRVIIMKVAN